MLDLNWYKEQIKKYLMEIDIGTPNAIAYGESQLIRLRGELLVKGYPFWSELVDKCKKELSLSE